MDDEPGETEKYIMDLRMDHVNLRFSNRFSYYLRP